MSKGPANGHHERAHESRKPGWWRRVRHWWSKTAVARAYGNLADRLYDWWHPPSEKKTGYYGYYGSSRQGRLRRAWDAVRHGIRHSPPARLWRALSERFTDWYYPVVEQDPTKPNRGYGYGYYGQLRRGRLSILFRGIRSWIRQSVPMRLVVKAANAFYNWYYPEVDDLHPYPAYGYYGRRRRSRLALAVSRVRRGVRESWVGRVGRRLKTALWEWWYPEVPEDHGGYGYGYYGGLRRRSRLALAVRAVRRRWRASWAGRTWRRFSVAAWEWYYPEPDPAALVGYGYGRQKRISRPVRFLRRRMKWFRSTWLGRKLRWLLDDIESFLFYLGVRIRQDFGWWRIRQLSTRWQTWVVVGGLAAVVGFGYWYGVPYYRSVMERQYAQQAQLLLKKGDLPRAILRARQTLALNSSNAIATRVFGDVADFYNSPMAMYWRQRASALTPNTTNSLALASTALKMESFPFPTAQKALGEVTAEARETPTFHLIAGAMALKLNKLDDAERHYTEALKLSPNDPAARMSLAVVRLHSQNPKIIADSRTALELLRTDRGVGLLALRSLVAESVDRRELDRAETLSKQVITNAQAAFSDRVLHLAILNANRSSEITNFLRQTQTNAAANPMAIAKLVAWMNSTGRAKEALDWLATLPPGLTQQGLLPISKADCYVTLRAWDELEAVLMKERWPGLDHVRFAMLAMAGWRRDGVRQPTAWRLAVRNASQSPLALTTLVDLAAGWGWLDEVESVLWDAVEGFPHQSWPLESLTRFCATRGNTAGLRRVYATQMQRKAEDRLAQNNYAMTSLLLKQDLTQAWETAAKLHEADPGSAIFASTYAFSLYQQGRTKDAIAVLGALPLDQLDDPSLALYYGVFLVADGQKEVAKNYLDRAAKAFMLPEEAALLKQARAM